MGMNRGLPRRCIACGSPFDSSKIERKLCKYCEVALERMNGYVVPVVRCKDCKWFDPNENIMPQSGTCGYHEMVKMFWDFCSRGKVEEEVQSE